MTCVRLSWELDGPLTRSSIGCFLLGFILDMKSISQRRRAQLGLLTVVATNVGVYIWSIIMQVKFNRSHPGAIDWDDALYPSSFLPYFFVQTTGPMSQSYMYWLLSSFATDAQGMTVLDEMEIMCHITDRTFSKCPQRRGIPVCRL